MLTSRLFSALMALALLFAVSLSMVPDRFEQDPARAQERPNILLILTDDQPADTVAEMPKVRAGLMDEGVTFEQGYVSDPLCCPSRATILTGKYAHNHGVKTNSFPGGGAEKFRDEGLDRDTIATRLKEAGYSTGYFGKYFNEYRGRYVPPGWDRWFGWLGNYYSPGGTYRLNENGRVETYDREQVHDTDLLREKAVHFVRAHKDGGRPFFMYVAPNAPHTPAYAPERHQGMFSGRALPRPHSFDEEIVFDKPDVVRRPELTRREAQGLGDLYRKRLESLQSVDDMIEALIRALGETDQLDDTYIVFASDNGFFLGEHRLTKKSLPYEEAIRIPLLVRGPGVPVQKVDHLVINNDFAPTVAELAEVEPPGFVDGKSFAPLLRDKRPSVEAWQAGFMIEHASPSYRALRTNDRTYIEWEGGERELYDLREDPGQLQSVHETADRATLERLSGRLEALEGCAAEQCRAAERD